MVATDAPTVDPAKLLAAFLETTEKMILPQTREGMAAGNRIFGAAIFNRETLAPYSTATNQGAVSPLLHGEINCIQKFFLEDYPDAATRPDTRRDCVFYATHEPCSLCLSGITWSGFDKFYYLFTYEDTRDAFSIPMDITVLEQVFRVKGEGESAESNEAKPLYNRTNDYFTARPCCDLLEQVSDAGEKERLAGEMKRIKGLYDDLSKQFAGKDAGQGLRAE